MLRPWLAHPLTRDLNIDDPETTRLRQRIVREKGFLSQVYGEWYQDLVASLPAGAGLVLELGAGGGFMRDVLPGLITAERFFVPGVRIVLDGLSLPFAEHSLRGIVMTNVLHHLPNSGVFFAEASRCVRPGGVVSMIEPWVTPWSRFIYQRFHHEPFDPNAASWTVAASGPLSGANGALPWILFERDRSVFEREFPQWQVERVVPMMPFTYLLSGGVSLRSFLPGWSFRSIRGLERALGGWNRHLAMFAHVVLRRRGSSPPDSLVFGDGGDAFPTGDGRGSTTGSRRCLQHK
jgi:SAM-dependent methyltransferase